MPTIKKYLSRQAISDLQNIGNQPDLIRIAKSIMEFETPENRTFNTKLQGFRVKQVKEHEESNGRNFFPLYRYKSGSFRIIWTKNNNDYVIVRVGARKSIYDELNYSNLSARLFWLLHDSVNEVVDFFQKHFKFYPNLSAQQENICSVKNEKQFHRQKRHFEIQLFDNGSDLIVAGGAGTGKSICASNLAINFINNAKEQGFNPQVYYIAPQCLVEYFSKNPLLTKLIANESLTITTYRSWLRKIFNLDDTFDVPEWLELGTLRLVAQNNSYNYQHLILFHIYNIQGNTPKQKELTSIDHEKEISELVKIKLSSYFEKLIEYFAFFLTVSEILKAKHESKISNWEHLNELYNYKIKNNKFLTSSLFKVSKNLMDQIESKKIISSFNIYKEKLSNSKFKPSRTGITQISEIEIKNNIPTNDHVLILVDETQDLMEKEINLISNLAEYWRKNEINTNIRFYGDQNQRLFPTGYTWEQVKLINGTVIYLDENYRNSEQILGFSNQLLELQNNYINKHDARHNKIKSFKSVFSADKPRILIVDNINSGLKTLSEINEIVQITTNDNSLRSFLRQRPTVISMAEDNSEKYKFINYERLSLLEISDAKGMEFFSNICFCPFYKKQINSQNLMEWYTLFSRTENRLFLIITRDEKEKLETIGLDFDQFETEISLKETVEWINEIKPIELKNITLIQINNRTNECFKSGKFIPDIYEVLEESGKSVSEWEIFASEILKTLDPAIVKKLYNDSTSILFDCLLLRCFKNFWKCCETATLITDEEKKNSIFLNVINDLTQNNLDIEGARIRHFYLNPELTAFNYKDLKTDLVFNDAGIKGQTFDAYLPLYFAHKISSLKGMLES